MSAAFPSMARRPDGPARNPGSGPSANDNNAGPGTASALPPDACAVVEPVPRATHQGGRARLGQWRIRFAPRWAPRADPLTGWTGSGDPLETIELRFADRDAAMDFCRRQGVRFSIHGPPSDRRSVAAPLSTEQLRISCCSSKGPPARWCAVDPVSNMEEDCHPRFSLAG
ncbi:hypothetical protein GG804_28495 [Sphingomonas histidinilytica]|nr:hypothetical protein [Rhizorhabdus histidinilytica]